MAAPVIVQSPEVVGIIGKDDRVRMMIDARRADMAAETVTPVVEPPVEVPPPAVAAVVLTPAPEVETGPLPEMPGAASPQLPAETTAAGVALPRGLLPTRLSVAWQFNPDTVTLTNDAVTVLAPVWAALTVRDDTLALLRRRASRAYVDEAHRRGYRVWLTVQLLSAEEAHAILRRTELAAAAREAILALAGEVGADGVNLDAENHPAEDSAALTGFAAELGAGLRARGLVFSVCITRRAAGVTNRYDRPGLAQAADFLALMAYDEHWSTCPENGPVASLEWVEAGVAVTLDEVPPEKLLLGVPLYAYDWVLLPDTAAGPAPRFIRPVSFRALTLDEVWGLAADSITGTRRGDTIAVQAWLTPPGWSEKDGTMYMKFLATTGELHEIWFENIVSLTQKNALAGKYGLAGTAAWLVHFADREGLAWNVFRPPSP